MGAFYLFIRAHSGRIARALCAPLYTTSYVQHQQLTYFRDAMTSFRLASVNFVSIGLKLPGSWLLSLQVASESGQDRESRHRTAIALSADKLAQSSSSSLAR